MSRRCGVGLLLVLACSTPAVAQSRFEISGGVTWTGGFDAGGSDALLSRGTGGTPFTLFGTRSRVDAAAGLVARASLFFTGRFAVEAAVDASRPVLRVAIENDFEQATGDEATNTISSYMLGGSVLYQLRAGRVEPFVLAGAARLRQLDDERVSLVTGTEVHAGGGVRYRVTTHAGIRADVLASSRDRSLAFEQKRRTLPVISASFAYRF